MTFMTRAVRQFSAANQSQLESFGMDRFFALGDQAAVFRASFDNLSGTGRAFFNRLSHDPSILGDSSTRPTQPAALDGLTLTTPIVTTTSAGTVLATGFTELGFGDNPWLLTSENLAAIGANTDVAAWGKLQYGLAEIYIESQMALNGVSGAERNAALASFDSLNAAANVVSGYVAIDAIAANGDGAALLAALEALGLERGASFGRLAGGLMPLDSLDELANLDLLGFARPVYWETNAGSVQSQNVASMNVDYIQNAYGLTGAGISIGFLSDSFDTATLTTGGGALTIHYAQDITSLDLPAGINILADGAGAGVRDEGRAMAQLAYDIAPGSSLLFHTAFVSMADFAQGILDLKAAGARIIVDDVRYFAEPFFQDGAVAQAVDTVTAGGAMYFSSAGNQGTASYQSAFRHSGVFIALPDGFTYEFHDFDPGPGIDTQQSITKSGTVTYTLNWDQPNFSVSGGAGSQSNMSWLLINSVGGGSFTSTNNLGGDAIEIAQSAGVFVNLGLLLKVGDPEPGLMQYVLSGSVTINEFGTNSGTSYGHSNAAGAISVGASDWVDSGRFAAPYVVGEPMPYLETFSSRGDIPILFNTAGVRLPAPIYRSNVDFTAGDGGNNTFFGSDNPNTGAYTGFEADTSPNFYGTSAAAPNAAAIAALLMQRFPTATNAQIEQALKMSAIDVQVTYTGTQIGDGVDNRSGWGLIQADRALNLLQAMLNGDSVLARGEAAIISYETDTSTPASPDGLRFVLLTDIAAGTTIYITDRTWNGTAFTNAAGEGTYAYVAGAAQTAGTVVTLTQAQLASGGITLSNGGETLYMYQGGADAPTRFLFAADIADGNTTFNGNLTNTGLTNGVNAVAVAHDNAVFVGSPTGIAQTQLLGISTNNQWYGLDLDDNAGTPGFTEVIDTVVQTPFFDGSDFVIISALPAGGQSDVILRIGAEDGALTAQNIARMFRDNPAFNHISDFSLDLDNGYFFFVDSNFVTVNRIMRGNIADLVSGNQAPVFTQLFATDGDGEGISSMEVNRATDKIVFVDGSLTGDFEGGWEVRTMNYDGTANVVVATIDTENDGPSTFGVTGIADYALRQSTNTLYLVGSLGGVDGLGFATIYQNHLMSVNLTTGAITTINMGAADPRTTTGGGAYDDGRLDPNEGQIIAIDVDQTTGIVYFITQPISPSATSGVWSWNPATDVLTELWQQPSRDSFSTLQTFPISNMINIEVDEIGGRIYITTLGSTDHENDGTPGVNEHDASIHMLAIGAPVGTAPTRFVRIYEPTALGSPIGLEINYDANVSVTTANATYTESTNLPNSPAGPVITPYTNATITDPDQATLYGATVAITNGFVSGDTLSFTNSGGITGTYTAATGLLVFTGAAGFAAYQTVLNSVRFTNAGDNPTDYGLSNSRTLSITVFDGLTHSDLASVNITVVGINDAPVNTVSTPQAAFEDVGKVITGLSVADPDADPANEDITVTLSVLHGTITIFTGVPNGIQASDVVNNGTASVTITATQNEINATFGNAAGVTYLNTLDFNGVDTLTMVTNDLGNNGNDPGLTGTGTSEQDSDNVTINIAPVNDAPVVAGDGTEDSLTILEDTPSAVGQTVSVLFSGQYSDQKDNQIPNGGASAPGAFSGIAVVANASSGATGQWQWLNGAVWTDIGTITLATSKLFGTGVALRFNPALNYNGPEPLLTVRLIDNSLGFSITNGQVVDLSGPGATGGTTAYSAGSVTLGGTITAVNDAPVNTVGGTLTVAEDSGANNVTGISIADVDANPATDVFTVTLDVLHGTLTLSGSVPSGVITANITGNGTATVTVTGTINQINTTLAAVGGLTYSPTGNYNGSDRVQITTDDGGATGLDPGATGTATSEADVDSKTINVTAVNDPVTTAAPPTLTAAEDATNVAITGLSISDLDATLNPAGVYDVTLSATNGTITLTTLTGLTFTVGDGTADATMTFHGTLAAINTALATAGYTPTGNYNGSATITLGATDTFGGIVATGTGAATNDSDVINVTVTAVNDPVTTAAPPTLTLNEDATNVAVTGLSISDIDTSLAPAGVYEVTLSATAGSLTLTTLAGLTFTAGDGTGDATMTFHGTLAAINTALATAAYTPPANYNGPAQITLSATDTFGGIVATGTGAATSDSDIVNVTVTAVNDTPVVSVVASVGSIEQVAGTIDATATISDVDLGARNGGNGDFGGSALTVGRNGGPAAQDLLTFGPSGAFTVNGSNLEAGGLVFATFTGGNGSNLVITFTSSGTPATQALVNAVVQSLQYTYTGDTPPASIVMNYSFNDGAPANAGQGAGGSPTGTDAITINITDTAENAPPVIDLNGASAGIDNAAAYTEQAAPTVLAPGLTVNDIDSPNLTGATVQVGAGFLTGLDLLTVNGATNGTITGITFSYVAATGTLTLTGSATLAQYQAVLAQVGFESTSDNPGTSRTITWTVNDGTGNSAPATTTITVTPVNDEPTLVATGASTTLTEGAAAVDLFSAVTATTIEAGQTFTSLTLTVSNVTDGAAETLTFDGSTVALTNGNAVTTATNGLNVTVTVVAGTATVTFSGAALSAAALQTLVDGLAYGNSSQNPTDANRVITLTQVVDSGSNAAPNDNTTTLGVAATVNVDPVNDAPVNTVPGTQTINEDATITFSSGNGNQISIGDVDAGTGIVTVTLDIASGSLFPLPASGATVTGAGTNHVVISGTLGQVNGAINTLIYQPLANANGPFTLTITTEDNGNAGTGGNLVDIDTVTININAVNDAPVVDLDGVAAGVNYSTTFTEDGAAVAIGSGVLVSDPDSGNGDLIESATITLTDRVAGDSLTLTGALPPGIVAVTTNLAGSITIQITGPGTGAQYQALIESILYSTTSQDPTVGGTDPARTITVTVNDGTTNSAVATTTVNITAVNDSPVAQPDAFTITEAGTIVGGNLFANNGSGADSDPDGPPLAISAVNGSGANLGVQITLASGALLTVNANGTFNYNPNGVFDPTPTAGSGASNTPAQDSFTYTLAGGNTVTVTLTITGLDTDDLLIGTIGQDVLSAGNGTDTIYALADDDTIDGGAGIDTAYLGHDLVFTSSVLGWTIANSDGNDFLTNVEIAIDDLGRRNLLAGSTGFATIQAASNAAVDNDYIQVGTGTNNENVTYSDQNLFVFARTGAVLNTSFSTATAFGISVYGGAGSDNITTSANSDSLDGGLGADVLAGGGGSDYYVVDQAGDQVIEGLAGGYDIVFARGTSYTLTAGQEVESLGTYNELGTDAVDLSGNAFANRLVGNDGSNGLNGGGGIDIMYGNGGNDFYVMDSADDRAIETLGDGYDIVFTTGASYTLEAGQELEGLGAYNQSSTNALNLTGNEFDNLIVGNAGANTINGGFGADVVYGLGGADIFAFTTALGGGNVDYLVDFATGVDQIALDHNVFVGLGIGALNANAFVAGTAAQDADDRIIYNSVTGNLLFDADGNGAGAAVLFATVVPGTTLTASDFQVI